MPFISHSTWLRYCYRSSGTRALKETDIHSSNHPRNWNMSHVSKAFTVQGSRYHLTGLHAIQTAHEPCWQLSNAQLKLMSLIQPMAEQSFSIQVCKPVFEDILVDCLRWAWRFGRSIHERIRRIVVCCT